MTIFIPAVVTRDALAYYALYASGDVPTCPRPMYFRLGEGGWEDTGLGRMPRTPAWDLRVKGPSPIPQGFVQPLLGNTYPQDLDAIVDVTRTPGDENDPPRYPLTGERYAAPLINQPPKLLANVEYVSPFQVRCNLVVTPLDSVFYTDSPNLPPEYWEVAIYSNHPDPGCPGEYLMMAYGTFPVIDMFSAPSINSNVIIAFGI